ncbi:MAG: hypothetical protein ACYC6A_20400 [Armatimonadota bacterium]
MRHALLALCLPALLALFLVGCSDGGTQSPPGSQVSLTVLNTELLQTYTPLWAAFQDGTAGTWTRLTPGADGRISATVTDPAGAYGLAVAVDEGYSIKIYYMQGTLADGAALTLPVEIYDEGYSSRGDPDRLAGRPAARSRAGAGNLWEMWVSISNIPPFDVMCMGGPRDYGYSTPAPSPATASAFLFPADRPGDFCVLLDDRTAPYQNGLFYIHRNLTHDAGEMVDEYVDFSPPYDGSKLTSEVTERSTVTVAGALYVEARWVTANGTELGLRASDGSSTVYPLIPAAAATENDRYRFLAADYMTGRQAYYWSQAPATSFSLPDAFTCGFSGLTYTGLDHPDASLYRLYTRNEDVRWIGVVSAAWLAAAGADDFTLPDFSGVDGWQPAWNLAAASISYAYATKVESNFPLPLPAYLLRNADAFLLPTPADGAFLKESEYEAYD